MNATNRPKLSVMFFLEYVIWGAWLPLVGVYMTDVLKFTGDQRAWVFNAFAIASLTAMFFGGQLADRYFSQEKFLALSHLIGGLSILGLAYVKDFPTFFGLMLLHCFFYVPTLSVTNALAFANLEDAQKDFGKVRLWGTIGWIAASWPLLLIDESKESSLRTIFFVSAIASFLQAGFSLTLPHTPPSTNKGSAFAPFEAIKLLAIPSILILFVVTFFDSLVHYSYFFWTGNYFKSLGLPVKYIGAAMSIGQVMEIVAMATLGWFLKNLGWRKTMIIGILGQAVRFGVYSMGTPSLLWAVIAVNVVHGFAYACFFATVYIFVDENFPKDIRTSAQSLFNMLILGIAQFASNILSGRMSEVFKVTKVVDGNTVNTVNFHQLFLVPMGFAIFAAVLLAVFFHPPKTQPVELEAAPVAAH